MYSSVFVIHKGVACDLRFVVLDQAQRPVKLGQRQLFFTLKTADNNTVQLKRALEPVNLSKATYRLTLTSSETALLQSGITAFSVSYIDNNDEHPLFTNQHMGADSRIDVREEITPVFSPSIRVTIPNQLQGYDWEIVDYVSSTIDNSDSVFSTVQVNLDMFDGVIYLEGSTNTSDWYQIYASTRVTDLDHSVLLFAEGFHPYIRVRFNSSGGTVSDILYRGK